MKPTVKATLIVPNANASTCTDGTNITDKGDSVGVSVCISRDTGLNICTEADTDPVKQQQEMTHRAQVQKHQD